METKGVLRARRRGIGALSRNSNSGPPRRNGGTSVDRAMATSHLLGPCVSVCHPVTVWRSGKATHDIASLLISPCRPSVRNPPRYLIISRRPRK